MTRTHKVKCDKCGIMEDLVPFFGSPITFIIPRNWTNFDNVDYCPKCWKKVKQAIKEVK